MTRFVAGDDHRNALTKQECAEEIANLTFAKAINVFVVSLSFNSKVETIVVVFAVAVFFSVVEIVFLVVSDEIVQRKSVVRGDEIDAT